MMAVSGANPVHPVARRINGFSFVPEDDLAGWRTGPLSGGPAHPAFFQKAMAAGNPTR